MTNQEAAHVPGYLAQTAQTTMTESQHLSANVHIKSELVNLSCNYKIRFSLVAICLFQYGWKCVRIHRKMQTRCSLSFTTASNCLRNWHMGVWLTVKSWPVLKCRVTVTIKYQLRLIVKIFQDASGKMR